MKTTDYSVRCLDEGCDPWCREECRRHHPFIVPSESGRKTELRPDLNGRSSTILALESAIREDHKGHDRQFMSARTGLVIKPPTEELADCISEACNALA